LTDNSRNLNDATDRVGAKVDVRILGPLEVGGRSDQLGPPSSGPWRPITAIRLGDDDTNPDTTGDPAWTPLFPTPPGTPPYPDHSSGYNCVTGSMMNTAKGLLRDEQGRVHDPQQLVRRRP
jgi:hypothetical protein